MIKTDKKPQYYICIGPKTRSTWEFVVELLADIVLTTVRQSGTTYKNAKQTVVQLLSRRV